MKIFCTNIFWNIYHPGILAGTTRLLVTHNPAVLQFMDSVVVVKSGEIVDQGSYSDLVARGGLAGLLAEGGQQEGVDGEEGEKKEVVKKEDGPLVETETDSARLTEDEEALTGKVSELLYRTFKTFTFFAAGSLDGLPAIHTCHRSCCLRLQLLHVFCH